MRPVVITRTLGADDADGIALAQHLATAVALNLNGALVVAGVAVLGSQRRLVFTAGGGDDLTSVDFTIIGRDDQGNTISEVLAGPADPTPVTSVLSYAAVVFIIASAAFPSTDTVTVGTSAVGASLPVPIDQYLNPTNVAVQLALSGTINATVQYTPDNVFDVNPANLHWYDDTDLDNLSSGYTTATIVAPISAIRLLTNSGTGTGVMTVRQGGAAS